MGVMSLRCQGRRTGFRYLPAKTILLEPVPEQIKGNLSMATQGRRHCPDFELQRLFLQSLTFVRIARGNILAENCPVGSHIPRLVANPVTRFFLEYYCNRRAFTSRHRPGNTALSGDPSDAAVGARRKRPTGCGIPIYQPFTRPSEHSGFVYSTLRNIAFLCPDELLPQ